jgi:uncharacterized protein (TIGR03790 family)
LRILLNGRFATKLLLSALVLNVEMCAGSGVYAQSRLTVLPLVSEEQMVLTPATLGIIVNGNDPDSIELGRRYAEIRGVPAANIVELKLPRVKYIARHLMVRELERLRASPNYARLAAFALAFDKPYRVDANQSITSAISQGIAPLSWRGNCNLTISNPDAAAHPGDVLAVKPAMLLFGGGDLRSSIALAERGKAADASDPPGDVFLLKTSDAARSMPREMAFERAFTRFGGEINIVVRKSDSFQDQLNILGFQTGLAVLKQLDTLGFVPGAYADHLTSFGGAIADKTSQTPASELVRAGATASFGTVREPCNYASKFPDPEKMLGNYLRGDSILEAYWKSVAMTTEGLFIGEPLSRPFPILDARLNNGQVSLSVNRHTLSFLAHGQTSKPSDATERAKFYSLRLYAVQSGAPEFLRSVMLPIDSQPGDFIETFSVDAPSADRLSLGVLRGG